MQKYSFVYLTNTSDEVTDRRKWSKKAQISTSYPICLIFNWESFPSLKIKFKKERLFWRWATHFFQQQFKTWWVIWKRTGKSASCLACEAEPCFVLYLMYHILDAGSLQCGNKKLSISGDTCLKYQKQTDNM